MTNRFRYTFTSPWESLGGRLCADYIGQPFTIVAVIDEPDDTHDAEVLPMYRIRFADGFEVDAWPEEVLADDDEPCDTGAR